jgi:chemotaxis protein methyltransferase CheR
MHQTVFPDRISDAIFKRFAVFIQNYCGIQITPQKRTMVEMRLYRRMRTLGVESVDDYCAALFGGDQAEAIAFINEITTNKTDFFREPVHFDFLAENILPQIACSGRHNMKIWSAASSTGAEAYSCAMLLEDFRRRQRMDYSILATDISTDVLQTGANASYPAYMMDPIPETMRQRYVLVPRDPACKEFRIVPALRQKVAFHRLNLMDRFYPMATDFDVIFCRNILIYFDQATQIAVLSRLTRHLRTGGFLITGHSETVRDTGLPLQSVLGGTIHQRIDGDVSEGFQISTHRRMKHSGSTAFDIAS